MLYSAGRKWAMHHSELRALLGCAKGLPVDGMPERVVNGVTVYVLPFVPSVRKSSKHRVMAICPACGRHMSAGRLASQHYRKVHEGKA